MGYVYLEATIWILCGVLHTLPSVCRHRRSEAQFSHRRFSIWNSEESPDLVVLHWHKFSLNLTFLSCNYEGVEGVAW